ncbi:nuclease-related domain-containing protein [Bacillus sp. JCM 19034]|uniref:nuclease-related domain-containing protein n=1 Tax=Bacillus sp. JCM 19034 TaxID=1481928 RepID=UPI0007847B17|nr:nuclease-related domain-containing protein [Bacillus sp. JCM 19034]
MIVKPLRVPPILFQLDALRRRLPRQHERQADIKEQWRRRVAGFKGEQSLAYELSLIDQDEYLVFHDVRLPIGEYFAQFDLLILCSRFIVIIEVKILPVSFISPPPFTS